LIVGQDDGVAADEHLRDGDALGEEPVEHQERPGRLVADPLDLGFVEVDRRETELLDRVAVFVVHGGHAGIGPGSRLGQGDESFVPGPLELTDRAFELPGGGAGAGIPGRVGGADLEEGAVAARQRFPVAREFHRPPHVRQDRFRPRLDDGDSAAAYRAQGGHEDRFLRSGAAYGSRSYAAVERRVKPEPRASVASILGGCGW
jgi:hypothetical protein